MDRRPELHDLLVDLLGSSHVYFQPPETVKLIYPCIIYSLARIDVKKADNAGYIGRKRYTVSIISKDPDYSLPDEFAFLPLCSFDRHYTADNLNHWVYDLYY